MKKVIAAAAGLLLAGTMVSSAVADVTLSGDSRVRFYYQDGYLQGSSSQDDDESHWNSRVRIKINADMESGVYMRSRIKLDASTWNGDEGNTVKWDYAYLGVPLGNGLAVEGGNMDVTITDMVFHDEGHDALAFKYKKDNHAFLAFYAKVVDEYTSTLFSENGDEDANAYGAKYVGTFDAFTLTLGGVYLTAENVGDSFEGYTATARIEADFGGIAFTGDIAIQEEEFKAINNVVYTDVFASGIHRFDDLGNGLFIDDDGTMGYVTATIALGEATSVTGVAGYTEDAVMEPPVGFIMIGGDTQITPSITSTIGQWGNTVFAGAVLGHQLNEKTALTAAVGYADIEPFDSDTSEDITVFEISGKVAYAINDDATFSVIAGFENIDGAADTPTLSGQEDEDVIGVGAELAITF